MRDPSRREWRPVGAIDPRALAAARAELHWALNALCGVGKALLPHAEDDSERSFTWMPTAQALIQAIDTTPTPFCIGLRPADASVIVLDTCGRERAVHALQGASLQDLLLSIEDAVAQHAGAPLPAPLPPPTGLAEHALGGGAAFSLGDAAACAEIACYLHNAFCALSEVRDREPEASPVRCWPHHFDMATLLSLGRTAAGEDVSVNVGLSLGDEGIDEPYAYVVPWPVKDGATPARLPHGGVWRTQGWFGAVLTASAVTEGDGKPQEIVAREFYREAIIQGRAVLRT